MGTKTDCKALLRTGILVLLLITPFLMNITNVSKGQSSRGKRFVSQIWGMIQDNREHFKKSYAYWQDNEITRQFGIK